MSTLVNLQEWLAEKNTSPEPESKLFLTEKEVRSFEAFKEASPEEVANIIDTLYELALINYDIFYQEVAENQLARKAA